MSSAGRFWNRGAGGVSPVSEELAARAGDAPEEEQEWLDRDDLPLAETEAALGDLERLYHHPLGSGALRRAVLPLLTAGSPQRWLDLGAGGGHVGSDLRARAASRGAQLEMVSMDRRLRHLLVGRRRGHRHPSVVADATALPFRTGALAGALSHLFFHHFEPDANRRILAEMRRVAGSVVVVDLRRCLSTRLLVRPFLWLLRLGPTAYHDGIVSVARSYSLRQIAELLPETGKAELVRRFPGRFSLRLTGSVAPEARAPGVAGDSAAPSGRSLS